jgi:hypothetical protein
VPDWLGVVEFVALVDFDLVLCEVGLVVDLLVCGGCFPQWCWLLFVPNASCDGCCGLVRTVQVVFPKLLCPSKNRLRISFLQISHDFFGGNSWIGHFKVHIEWSVWVPVKRRKSGRIVVPGGSVISESQVICKNSQH